MCRLPTRIRFALRLALAAGASTLALPPVAAGQSSVPAPTTGRSLAPPARATEAPPERLPEAPATTDADPAPTGALGPRVVPASADPWAPGSTPITPCKVDQLRDQSGACVRNPLYSPPAPAQPPQPPPGGAAGAAGRQPAPPRHLVGASAGLGLSYADDDSAAGGRGFYLQAEYAYGLSAWFQPRAYAGVVATSSKDEEAGPMHLPCQSAAGGPCEVSAQIGFLGAKGRVIIPIPYVAPFFELGLGLSLGKLTTMTNPTDERRMGLHIHVPFALGLLIGGRYRFEVSFQYLAHPAAAQTAGAVAVGFMWGLR